MTDYTKVASYDVRYFLWQELQNASLFNKNDYFADGFTQPLVPIIPSQQVPEFNNLLPGKPFIIYDVMQKGFGNNWWISEETITFEVTSINGAYIQTIINFITDLFRRYDKSAGDVNVELTAGSPFRFLWFNLESADPIQSFQNEGGFMTGLITIHYAYTREVDYNTGRYI
jgi:hypothetical protein